MLKTRVLVPAVATALLLAGVSPGASEPSPYMILGKWRGTSRPTDCPQTELTFTRDVFTSVQDGVDHRFGVLGIAWQGDPGKMVSVMASFGPYYYWIVDNNNIQLQTPFGLCDYTREK